MWLKQLCTFKMPVNHRKNQAVYCTLMFTIGKTGEGGERLLLFTQEQQLYLAGAEACAMRSFWKTKLVMDQSCKVVI